MGIRQAAPLEKVISCPAARAMQAQGLLVRTRSSTIASSNSGVMRRLRIWVFGTRSRNTVCQMPLWGV